MRRTRRSGNDDGVYAGRRQKIFLMNSFLRSHTMPENGIQLCNGDDERRRLLVVDDTSCTVDVTGGEEAEGELEDVGLTAPVIATTAVTTTAAAAVALAANDDESPSEAAGSQTPADANNE